MIDKPSYLTHATGAPVSDNLNIQTAGRRGPALLQDIWLIEKLAHFDREVIPERRMHAKGSGAHGTFTVTHDVTHYTKAKIFSEIGRQTPMFARFSTVAGERGAADAERDIRGFALKFYTEEGNWDMVGNNTPVFFFRDPLRFPDLNHAIKRDPRTGMRSADNNWDFWTLLPEALHQVTIVMSERGIPRSYRHMHGFGSHTYSFINVANERTWVKFHFRTQQGIENLKDAEAEALVGKDRETHQRDLFESIEHRDYPRWTLFIQVMTDAEAKRSRRPTSCRASASRPTRCCRRACSPTETPSATDSASISTTSRSTHRSARSIAITATAQCAPTGISAGHRPTSQTAGASGRTSPTSTNRRSRSKAPRRTGITASTTITISSRAICSGR